MNEDYDFDSLPMNDVMVWGGDDPDDMIIIKRWEGDIRIK